MQYCSIESCRLWSVALSSVPSVLECLVPPSKFFIRCHCFLLLAILLLLLVVSFELTCHRVKLTNRALLPRFYICAAMQQSSVFSSFYHPDGTKNCFAKITERLFFSESKNYPKNQMQRKQNFNVWVPSSGFVCWRCQCVGGGIFFSFSWLRPFRIVIL